MILIYSFFIERIYFQIILVKIDLFLISIITNQKLMIVIRDNQRESQHFSLALPFL